MLLTFMRCCRMGTSTSMCSAAAAQGQQQQERPQWSPQHPAASFSEEGLEGLLLLLLVRRGHPKQHCNHSIRRDGWKV